MNIYNFFNKKAEISINGGDIKVVLKNYNLSTLVIISENEFFPEYELYRIDLKLKNGKTILPWEKDRENLFDFLKREQERHDIFKEPISAATLHYERL